MDGKNRPTRSKSNTPASARPAQNPVIEIDPTAMKKPKPAEASAATEAQSPKKRPREVSTDNPGPKRPRVVSGGTVGPQRPREASKDTAGPQRPREASKDTVSPRRPREASKDTTDPKRPREVSKDSPGSKRKRGVSGGAVGPKRQREASKDTPQKPPAKETPSQNVTSGQEVSDEQKKNRQAVTIAPVPLAKQKPLPEDDPGSVYEDVEDNQGFVFGANPMQEYRRPTFTGITELPVKDFFLMILLWSPRFFSPWILSWHEFNVFILADPTVLESKEVQKKLLTVDLSVFGGACLSSLLVSIIADLASLRYYVYMVLLAVYTLCPIAGGYVDVVLRSRMYNNELYNSWFSSIVLMRIAKAISFVFFPVQFTCIFTEKSNMSRQAHYNWTSVFAFLEFANAYVAFWVIPEKCPTSEWKQIVVWVIILGLLFILIVVTLVFTIVVKSMRYTLMICCVKTFGLDPGKYLSKEYGQEIFEDDIEKSSRLKKLQWFGLLLIPLVFSSFVFATFERFVPDEDWDKHYVLSATSMFYLGRLLGVMVMVVVLFWIRHGFKRILQIPIFRGDVLVLGLPHLFNIVALIFLVGRFATLSAITPGEVIVGPIPDDSKAVVVFINQMFRNKTVCVRAEYFRSVKVRAYHYATRELDKLEPIVDNIEFTVVPEPGVSPPVVTGAVLNHPKKKDLYIYSINLFSYLNKELNETDKYREYMNDPKVIKHSHTELHGRPERNPSLLIIRNFERRNAKNRSVTPWYMMGFGKPIDENTTAEDMKLERPSTKEVQFAQFFDKLNKTGKWFVQLTFDNLNRFKQPNHSSTSCEFDADEYSLYVVSFYTIGPTTLDMGIDEFMKLVRCKVYKIAEVAGPEGHRLPSKKVLQTDKAIQLGLMLAGMSAGGLFVGIVYLFWMDPPFPRWQTTSLAIFWILMIGAAESPKVKLVDVGLIVSTVLLVIQVILTCLHVFASMNFYTPKFNFRKRPD